MRPTVDYVVLHIGIGIGFVFHGSLENAYVCLTDAANRSDQIAEPEL